MFALGKSYNKEVVISKRHLGDLIRLMAQMEFLEPKFHSSIYPQVKCGIANTIEALSQTKHIVVRRNNYLALCDFNMRLDKLINAISNHNAVFSNVYGVVQ